MDDELSSERKYREPPNQISPLEYPICDGSGKQFNLQYTRYIPSSIFFPLSLTKIPTSRNFKSYDEYSYNMKKWYTTMKIAFSRLILPTKISFFYRRPLKIKTLRRGKNLITFDQLLQIEEILINEQQFDENSLFKNNIKTKSNLISQYISYTNKWIGWSIPPFPEPDFFMRIEDFFLAAKNWYTRCSEILNENAEKYITQSNLNVKKKKITHTNSHSHRIYNIAENIQKENIFNISHSQFQLNRHDDNNENQNDKNNNIDLNNNDTIPKPENDKFNDTNFTYDNEHLNDDYHSDTDLCKNAEIETQDNFPSKKYDINSRIPNFNFLMHPRSFHDEYNFEIVQTRNNFSMNSIKKDFIPSKKINQNSFFETIQSHSKLNIDKNPKLKENVSNSLKEMNYFDLKNASFPNSNKNPIIGDLINYGCHTTIRNSYPVPLFEKYNDNDNDDYSTSARNFLYLIDLDKNEISKEDCNSLFQYVLSNHNNELFQNLLNNTQFLYKIAIVLSYYIPSSKSSFNDIQIIEPFDENDNFLSIDGFGENFDFTPEIQIKLDLREIHGLLFQWHFSDVIYRIFGLIQSDNRQIEEASQTFLKRAEFYKTSFNRFTEKKSFPFSFSLANNESQGNIFGEVNTDDRLENDTNTCNTNNDKIKNDKIDQSNNDYNKTEYIIHNNDDDKTENIIHNNDDKIDLEQDQVNTKNNKDNIKIDKDNTSEEETQTDSEASQKLTQFYNSYKHLTRSYNGYTSVRLTKNSSLSQFSHLMKNNSDFSKTMNDIADISSTQTHPHSKLNATQNSDDKRPTQIDFTSHSFIALCTSMFKVTLLYGVSTYICPSCFVFLKYVSKSCSDDKNWFKKFTNEILYNRLMCMQFIKDFTNYSIHIRFDISDSSDLLFFCCRLFLVDVRQLLKDGSFKIRDFEWTIQFFQHMARYLIDSYPHVFLVECVLRFVLRSINAENAAEWKSTVSTFQGLLYAYIPYENDWRLLSSELRSFSLLMKSTDSFSFFDSDEKIGKIFRFLTVNNHEKVLEASWKILGVLFVYHSEAIASYALKFQCLADFIEKAVSSLKKLTKFDLAACQLLKLLAKLIELAFPSKYSAKLKCIDQRNYFAGLSCKNAGKGLNELLRILAENQIRPNYLAFTIRNCLKNPENSPFCSYVKIVERYETAVASRPAIKKLFINYNIDFEMKTKKNLYKFS